MSVMRFLLLDDTEHHLIGAVLDAAERDGHREQADLWRLQSVIRCDEFLVHGLADAGHLMALPSSTKLRGWMVARLRALAERVDHADGVMGWAPRFYVDSLARRIEDQDAPAGEPGSVRVSNDDLRVLLDAAESATARPPQNTADTAWHAAIADVVHRVGTVAAMVWTGPRG